MVDIFMVLVCLLLGGGAAGSVIYDKLKAGTINSRLGKVALAAVMAGFILALWIGVGTLDNYYE